MKVVEVNLENSEVDNDIPNSKNGFPKNVEY